MRALLQRVHSASVVVDGKTVGEIGGGLLILICAMQGDTEAEADQLAAKIAKRERNGNSAIPAYAD